MNDLSKYKFDVLDVMHSMDYALYGVELNADGNPVAWDAPHERACEVLCREAFTKKVWEEAIALYERRMAEPDDPDTGDSPYPCGLWVYIAVPSGTSRRFAMKDPDYPISVWHVK